MSYGERRSEFVRPGNYASEGEAGGSGGSIRHERGASVTMSDPSQPIRNEERANVRPCVAEIDQLIDHFRAGQRTKLEVILSITQLLNDDGELTTQEKSQSLELYLSEVNSFQGRAPSVKRERGEPGGSRVGREDLPRFVADEGRGPGDGGSSGGDSSSSSESGEGEPRRRKKLRLSDMPWHGKLGEQGVSQNPSCIKSANIIRKLNRDLKSAKLYIRLSPGAPRGIPLSEWEHIFKGEAVDLDKILSSLHRVTIDPERKASFGDTEISIGGVEAKWKVETSSEWSTTSSWRSASRAVGYVFGHREQELAEYGDYIKRLFTAKRPGSHGQVILFDKGVRNEVGGGQTLLLTNYHYFTSLYAATLQDDGVEYKRGGRGRGGNSPGEPKTDTCLHFNSLKGCRFVKLACKYKHVCLGCGQMGHGKPTCIKTN